MDKPNRSLGWRLQAVCRLRILEMIELREGILPVPGQHGVGGELARGGRTSWRRSNAPVAERSRTHGVAQPGPRLLEKFAGIWNLFKMTDFLKIRN